MFAKFFKPKWQVGSIEERLKAVEQLDEQQPKQLAALQQIVTGDEHRLRGAAVKKLTSREILGSLLKEVQDDAARELIQRQLINLTDESGLGALDDTALLDVALQHQQARIRLLAAEKIDNAGLLDVLSKESQDKAVLRYVRAELKTVREERAEAEAEARAIDGISETLENLAGRSEIDQFFLAKYDKAVQQWQQVASAASSEQSQRYEAALLSCAEEVDRLKSEQEAERQRNKLNRELAETISRLQTQVESLKQRAVSVASIQTLLSEAATLWQGAGLMIDIPKDQQSSYQQARSQLEGYCNTLDQLQTREAEIQAAIREVDLFDSKAPADVNALQEKMAPIRASISWPEGVASPVLLQHWEQACYKVDQTLRELDANADEAIRSLARKRRQLDVHINKGELKIANRIHAQIHHLLEQLWGRELERQQQRLQPLEDDLQKLRDWHGFSTTPKKEELCERMEQLVDSELDPLDLVDAIKALQEEWREQTSVNIIEDDPLWSRFQEAGNKAYEPCEAYYQQQGELKQQNLQKRRELADQLAEYLDTTDWENADWQKVQKVLRTAREEWKRYEPVRFPDARPVHKQFFDLIDKLNDKLKGHWQANLEAKEALIEKANELVELEDLQQAIEKAIFLQKQWKEIGHTFRSREQKLWKAFRAACDAVFARRDEERASQRAESDARVAEADRLIGEMKALAKLGDADLGKSVEQAEALQAAFAELDLPEKLEKPLSGKFNDARRTYEQQFDGIAQRKRLQALDALAASAALCDQAEAALLEGSKPDLEELQQQLVEDEVLQSRIALIKQACEAGAGVLDAQQQNLEKLEQLAIELEVLMDVDTPEEFRGERMAYQLDKLSDGMGGGRDAADIQRELISLRKDWYAVGAVEPGKRQALQKRLEAVLAAA